MKFNASKDTIYRTIVWGSGLLFAGLAVGLAIPVYYEAGLGVSLFFFLLFGISSFFIFWLWFSTIYIVTDNELIIRFGPFKRVIPLASIKKIEKTYQQVASIALSKERYILHYNTYDYTIIAPENIEKFVQVINEKRTQPVELKQ
ncbi:hypothetical protein J2S00_003637 [Caldalkalibacillus uzonensis]|uniref:Uncharacterized protein YyaB-like PH domain-containing protein n=1 Tax=Caldalkalibacillus uzonensis TaxID=353224 RepID=A0ABU0CX59_9BACI|nr:PH domain-containing protein [Caldalkalibacillus uzonensis]MDQ0340797.1 hypothetical protein [Caldalkalibacillus uzonensis]